VTLIRLLQNGVRGFLKKDAHPNELVFAIKNVVENGYYYSSNASNQLANLFANKQNQKETLEKVILNEREIEFLKFSCSEMTYKEIAQKMGMNPRSLENYRESMFSKLNIKSRVGLALYAVKHGLVRF
jgi:DNA-binding NarL/FixJ family response regulator